METSRKLYNFLNIKFEKNIKASFVMPEHIMIFTKDDDSYEFEDYVRKNCIGIAFIKDESIKNELMKVSKVKELCHKDVYDIRSGLYHTIARTKMEKFIFGAEIFMEFWVMVRKT